MRSEREEKKKGGEKKTLKEGRERKGREKRGRRKKGEEKGGREKKGEKKCFTRNRTQDLSRGRS